MTAEIFERKFEIDSLAAVLSLSHQYYNATEDATPFNKRWVKAVKLIIDTARKNQIGSGPYTNYEYSFTRSCNRPTETLMDGEGWPSKYTGLVGFARVIVNRRFAVPSVPRTMRRSFPTSSRVTSCCWLVCVVAHQFSKMLPESLLFSAVMRRPPTWRRKRACWLRRSMTLCSVLVAETRFP